MPNTLHRRLLLAAPALALAPGRARATAYPDAPVTLVVPFSAGGAADLAARAIAAHAARYLPNPLAVIQVENRSGASGAVGTQAVARAKPDGLTLLLARVSASAILPATDPRTPYAWDEFSMLGLLDENPYVVCVRADSPWTTLAELAAALRGPGERLRFATTGPATLLDLGVRQMFSALGLAIDAGTAIPFRGGADAVAGLLEGRAQFMGANLSDMMEAIRTGRLRPLVAATTERVPALPQVPTAREAEVEPLARVTGWNGLFGPPGMAEEMVRGWSTAIAALRRDPGWIIATRRVGSIPRLLGPEETREYVRAQVALYRDLARRLGLL